MNAPHATQGRPVQGTELLAERAHAAVRVSVITPFLNAAPFIAEAIESVLAQTYAHWELLLIDDGSIDGSTEIARRYAEERPDRIHYLAHPHRENRGQSAARNLGIAHARGEYIAPLDADDLWLPHKLEQQVPLLDSAPSAAALFGRTFWWYSWTGQAEDRQRDFIAPLGVPANTLLEPPQLLAGCLRETVPMPLLTTMLIRRVAVEQVGGFEEAFRNPFEDQVFLSKLFLDYPVWAAEDCWIRYRRHENSACVVARVAGELEHHLEMYLDWAEQYLAHRGMRDSDLWRALQQRRWRTRHPHLFRVRTGFASLPGRLSRGLRAVLPV